MDMDLFKLLKHEERRLQTFKWRPPFEFPKKDVDVGKLAKAGFFYFGVDDVVACIFCLHHLGKWKPDSDPFQEHCKSNRTCPFMMGGDVGNVPFGEDPFPGPKRARPYDVCGLHPNFPADDPRSKPDQSNNLNQIMTTQPRNTIELSRANSANDKDDRIRPPNHIKYECKICYSNEIQLVFFPCGHSISCQSCASYLTSCPVCRTEITQSMRTYIV